MPGTHWVSIAGIPTVSASATSGQIMVFDSFGRASKNLLPHLFSKDPEGSEERIIIDTEYDAEQKKIQESCGQFSIAWLVFLEKYGYTAAQTI